MSTAAADPSPAPTGPQRALAVAGALPSRVDAWLEARRRLSWALSCLVLAVVAILVVVPAATGPGGVSPVDELWYTDALDKADRWEMSNTGDKVDRYARQVKACRGVIGVHPPTAACGAPQPDAALPIDGYTSADIHAPTYFFLTAVGAKVLRAVGLTNDLLIAGRLMGALWLALGMLAMVALARTWRAGWLMPVSVAVAVGTSPLLASVSGYLSPDALGLVVGSGVLIAVAHWQRGRLPTPLLLLVAVLPAFVKVPFVLAPLFGAVLVLVDGIAGRTSTRRTLTGAGVLVVGAGAGAVLWQLVRGLLAVGSPTLHPETEPPVAVSTFAKYLGYYLDSIPVTSGAPIPVSPILAVAVQPLAWLLLAASLGGLLLRRRDDPLQALCWAGTAGMVLGSIVLSLIVFVASGGFLIGTPRYGLALLPLYAVPLMCTRHPAAVLAVGAAAGASVLSHVALW